MKKTLSLTFALLLSFSSMALAADASKPTMPTQHWAYDAVNQLSKDGCIESFSDSALRVDKPLTRYEFAMLTARALENYGKAANQDKALLDKLSAEFAPELNTIGVRLTKVEAKPEAKKEGGFPKVTIGGTYDVYYQSRDFYNNAATSDTSYNWRVRLNGQAQINDDSTYTFRLTSQAPDKDNLNGFRDSTFKAFGWDWNSVLLDRNYITTQIEGIKTTVGRQPLQFDPNWVLIDGGAFSFDGIGLEKTFGKYTINAKHGRFTKLFTKIQTVAPNVACPVVSSVAEQTGRYASYNNTDIDSIYISYKDPQNSKLSWGVGNHVLYSNDAAENNRTLNKWYSFDFTYFFQPKWSLTGEYTVDDCAATAVTANRRAGRSAQYLRTVYGDQVMVKKGQHNVNFMYMNVGANSLLPRFTAMDTISPYNVTDSYKVWKLGYNYALKDNLWTEIYLTAIPDTSNTVGSDNYVLVYLRARF